MYIIISILIIIIIILSILLYNYYNLNTKTVDEITKQKASKIQAKCQEIEQQLKKIEEEKEKKEIELRSIDSQLVKNAQTVAKIAEDLKKSTESSKETIENNLHIFYDRVKEDYQKELEFFQEERISKLNDAYKIIINNCTEKINLINEQLKDFQSKQQTINEDIMRRREIEEKEEYFKISLTQDAIEDIAILKSIREKLHNHSNIDKLIYDVYLVKPVNEMIKRVLKGKEPSGIYKITRLKTGEIYIGKSTNIHDRWQQHAKTSFGVGNIAHSMLHTTIEKDGIENFTWELLEEISKDKLTEREKFWINFYNSKNYGLNEREG